MKIKDHIGKISWSFLDKFVMILFGLFTLYQLKFLSPSEYAFYAALLNINNWILMATDGFALQGLVQFGHKNKESANKIGLITAFTFSIGLSLIIFFARGIFAFIADDSNYSAALIVLPLTVVLTIPKNYITKIFYRELKFNLVFYLNLIFFGTQVVATFYFLNLHNYLNFDLMLLIYFFGAMISGLVALIMSLKYLKFRSKEKISIKEYLFFGVTVSQQSILHSIPKVYDLFIVSHFFGPAGAGVYQSAKTLYRAFDEAASAAHGLIYPAAVKLIAYKDNVGLKSMLTKAISMMLFVFIFLIIVLNLGLTDFIINGFGLTKYISAINIFNILILSALFVPLVLITPIMNAMNQHKLVLKYVFFSVIASMISFVVIGKYLSLEFMGLGLFVYNVVLGVWSYIYIRNSLGIRFKDLFRSYSDILNFINKK